MGLSFGRETAPESVINGSGYEITSGHTGTSIREYLNAGDQAASRFGLQVEMEADHLIIVGSSAKAVKRISGVYEESRISKEELEKSIEYNKLEIDEAISTGHINAWTIDASDLFDLSVEGDERVEERFNKEVPEKVRGEIFSRYLGKEFFIHNKDRSYKYELYEQDIMRLSLKFGDSLRVTKKIYDYIEEQMEAPFSFEISLDETHELTTPEDLLFYLEEWRSNGGRIEFIAPNIGFKKRTDFEGDLSELEDRVSELAAIAGSYGALLSIHSGSGTTPYSGKGSGTYRALLNATGGKLKYKISGVYIELVLEILSSFPDRTPERELYERIFNEVHAYLVEQVEMKGVLYSELLSSQLKEFEEREGREEREEREERSPRERFFRFNSYLALNFRDSSGKRYLRDEIVMLYNEDPEFKEMVESEVEKLTSRLVTGLEFTGNAKLLKDR